MQRKEQPTLAIVIPAYKTTFLRAALDSIAAQTCQDFRLYIGDDCCPQDIGSIVDAYRDRIDLVYHRFDSNLGGKDLVAQWERCIALSQDEPYIWLFSDDDVMEPNCVEKLFKQIEKTQGAYDLYHFDVTEIDGEGRVKRQLPEFPPMITAYDYYKAKTQGRLRSYVIENVFSRRVYEEKGGFVNFDLAWGSDVATWCLFAGDKGICRVDIAKVHWRRSEENITPDKSRQTAERKLMARCNMLAWAYDYFRSEPDIWPMNRLSFITVMRHYQPLVSQECCRMACQSFFDAHGHISEKGRVCMMLRLPRRIYRLVNHFVKL
ncbi:MAG: glycosyltransferase [Bacteroidaceae bacterium]|nr:glycosyltransferase [Bacteroidaceae bacterium]